MSTHYVNNRQFYEAIVAYRQAVAASPDNPPPVPEYIGECLLKIATRISFKWSYARYPYRDEMVSDAVENCLLYLHNFNPEKSQNPFSYFTLTIIRAFWRRIRIEKKELYGKLKMAVHRAHMQEDYATQDGESSDIGMAPWMNYDNIHEFIRDYEQKMWGSADDFDHELAAAIHDEADEYERGLDGVKEGGDDDDGEGTSDDREEY
jgi:hypothetical protein